MITTTMPIDARLLLLCLAAAAACAACALVRDAGPELPTWRIEFDGGSDDHGEIVLSLSEGGVEIAHIPAAIPTGTRENNVARRVEDVLRRTLPQGQYEVDRRGGERVFVAARDPAKDFEIRLVRNTTPGTEVRVVRD